MKHGASIDSGADRRMFLRGAAGAGLGCGLFGAAPPLQAEPLVDTPRSREDARFTVEAHFYDKLTGGKIRCRLCPRECLVGDRERGHCGVRENRGGVFYSLVHSRVCAAHVDPVEKKPLFHYLPGSLAFSVAAAGCNVNCKFCQNWEISQARPEQVPSEYMPPQRVAELAAQWHCPTVAFTYSEPAVSSEFLMDTADAAHRAGLRSIVISNGYIQPEPLREVYGRMDAVKIDLKAFTDTFYSKIVTGQLKPVLETIATLHGMGRWIEIVYLVIPTLNDTEAEFTGLARWVNAHLGPDVPVHYTQFHPDYLLKHLPVTPLATLERARSIALAEGLHFVYIGNIPGHPAENTWCPKCQRLLVERYGFEVRQMHIRDGRCPSCRQPIPGVWHA